MAGRWSKTNPPRRPGSYLNFEARPVERINAPLSGIVALPVVADWGPINEVVEIDSLGDYVAVFGSSITPGYVAAYQLFKGEAIEGRGGAARALVVRMANSDADAASVNIADTDDPANADALQVEALYTGQRGNQLRVQVVANVLNPTTHQDFVVFDGATEIERYTFAAIDLSELEAKVNGVSGFVQVTDGGYGEKLAVLGSPVALTGGDDGDTLTASEWTDTLEVLGTRRFSVFVPFDLTDGAIQTSISAWAEDQNAAGNRFVTVMGGGSVNVADTLDAALSRSSGYDNSDLVNCGAFQVRDTRVVAFGGPAQLTASTFAPRIAGIVAARGETAAVTFARCADVEIISGLSDDADFVSAIEGGVLTLAQDSNALAPVRIEQGVTSYQSDTEAKPKEIFSNLKFVRTEHRINRTIDEFGEANVIGRLSVSQETREFVIGQVQKLFDQMVEDSAILPGFRIFVAQDPPPSDTDDFVNLVYEVTLARDVRQLRGTVVIG